MLPEARVNKAPSTEFSEISSQNPPLDPFRSLTPPKGSLKQIPSLPRGSLSTEGSFSRPPTPMHFPGFSGQIPHQVTLGPCPCLFRNQSGAFITNTQQSGLPGSAWPPPGESRDSPPSQFTAQVPGSHRPTCSTLGAPCTAQGGGARGGSLKWGERLAPPPPGGGRTREAAFQRNEEGA